MCFTILGGSGTTNDGNTARTFFQQPALVAELTGVSETLIKNLGTLLGALASGFAIDTEKFEKLALATLRHHVELYPWFYLPVTVHKVLVHAPEIINSIALPIGSMSEEAQEAKNKDLRNYRELFTRKISRQDTMDDLMRRLLVSSDPKISTIRYQRKKARNLPKEVLSLLKSS